MNVKIFCDNNNFSSNTYVLTDKNLVIVIDPGFYSGDLKKYLMELGRVDVILLTHGHFDHIGGIDDLKEDYPNCLVYIHEFDYDFLTNPILNCSELLSTYLVINKEVFKIGEGMLNIDNKNIQVIHTPGHTRGSVLFYFKEDNILFTGDTIIGESIGATHFPTGNMKELENSIKKFIDLKCNNKTLIYSGHGEVMTYEKLIHNNEYVKRVLEK